MSDIVERLRSDRYRRPICTEAAAEIERLTADRERFNSRCHDLSEMVSERDADNERLRAVLRELIDECQEFGSPLSRTMTNACHALGPPTERGKR